MRFFKHPPEDEIVRGMEDAVSRDFDPKYHTSIQGIQIMDGFSNLDCWLIIFLKYLTSKWNEG